MKPAGIGTCFELSRNQKIILMLEQEMILQDMPLLKQMHRGSEKAFDELMDKFLPLISRNAFRILCDRSDSEYVTEKVFVDLWYDAMSYDDRYTLAEWLLSRTCLNSRMRISRRRMLTIFGIRPSLFSLSRPKVENVDDYLTTLAWELFCRASDNMTQLQRIVFSLSVLEEIPEYKVASIIQMSEYRVNLALGRAIQKIHAELRRFGRPEDYDRYIVFIRKISDSLIDLQSIKAKVSGQVNKGV